MAKTYYLTVTIKGQDSEQMITVPWNWQNDKLEPRLSDVRKKLGVHPGFIAKLPKPDQAWMFLGVGGEKIEVTEDEEAYELKLWKKADAAEGAVALTVQLAGVTPPPAPPPEKGAGDMDKIYVDVTVGAQPAQRVSFDKPATAVMLTELRAALTNSTTVTFGRKSQFLASGDVAIAIPDEERQSVASLDPAPTMEGDRGLYKVKGRSPEVTPHDPSKVVTDAGGILNPQTPLGGPNSEFEPAIGGGLKGDPVDLVDRQQWDKLTQAAKANVAIKKAKLFRGFNLPSVDVSDEGRASAGYPPLVEHSHREVYVQPEGLIRGDQKEQFRSVENSGYSRVEVQLKRSLSVSVTASMNYADQVSAEAAYGHAKASRADSQSEAFFLTSDVFVTKAVLEAPLSAESGSLIPSSKASVVPEFREQVDRMQTPADLYRLLKDWGSLIAGKVTVGGAFLFEERITNLMSFDAARETNSFKAKISGGNGVLTVGGGTAMESEEEWQRQVNEKFQKTEMTAQGGDPTAASAKNLPQWISTLASAASWDAILLENYYPIYVLLDDARREKFVQILGQAGRAGWRSQTILPSLRFIDYEWYMKFGQGDIFNLFGD